MPTTTRRALVASYRTALARTLPLALFGLAACASPVADASSSADETPGAASSAATSSLAGTYFFQIVSQRGEEVGNWTLHADGTLSTSSNGTLVLAGTWTSDG